LTIGIDIPDQAARQKGYATAAWDLFIRYFLGQGVDSIYTQTCQLNMPQYLENRKAWKHH
jgi:hypothetical protein